MKNKLFLAKVNIVSPYDFQELGGMTTYIGSYSSYMTIIYKNKGRYIDLLNKDREFYAKDILSGVTRYEIEEMTPLKKAVKRSLVRKR